MYHLHRIFPKKALLNLRGKPVGRNHDGQIGNPCEMIPLGFVILPAVVHQKARRIFLLLGAVKTAGLPLFTAHKIKMAAVTGKAPAIMERPVNFLTAISQILK